jgi:glycosyltransferase involved in cell wall biosynthesis
VREALGIAPNDVLALFVGSLDRAHYFKGIDVLLDALAQTKPPNLRLLVIGEGDLRATYERRARNLGLAGTVRFAGRVSDAALARHYAAADLVVLASRTRGEAFGLVLLEAMAAGKPVIAADLPGVRAVVRDTQGGVLVPPGDAAALGAAFADLAADSARRAALGQAGRCAVIERYTWEPVVRRLEHAYHTALDRPRSASAAEPLPAPACAPGV